MLSEHERREWDALTAQLMGDNRRARHRAGRAAPGLRQGDHRRRGIVLAAATVLLGAGYVLPFMPIILLAGLALYFLCRCWFSPAHRRKRSRGPG